MSRPPFVVRAAELPEHEGAYPAPYDAEKLSIGRDLGRAAGSMRLGAWQERLPPGRRTSFTHAHLREEELVYVLDGRPTLRWIPPGEAAQEVELAPGDFVSFPAGTGIAHTIVNRSDSDALLLVAGERHCGERASYPEDREFEAWRRERTPSRHWGDVTRPAGDATPPAYRIETERLVLRPWEPSDAAPLAALVERQLEHLGPWMPWAQKAPTVGDQLELIRGFRASFDSDRDYVYGVFLRDGRPIGGTGFHARVGPGALELGYWIADTHQGQGLVTEWCAALTRVAFEAHDVDRVEIHCDPDNLRSAAVAERLGFRHEATLARRAVGGDGRLRDSMIWVLFADEPPGDVVTASRPRALDGAGRRLL